VLFIGSVVLNTVVLFSLTSRGHVTHEQVCHLYVILHNDHATVIIPPNCP
jgi:hypothetical protein